MRATVTESDEFETYVCFEDVHRACHEAIRNYCRTIGDPVSLPWELLPEEERESFRGGVCFAMRHPEVSPETQHAKWLADKISAGWRHGPVKDPAEKTHPCIAPYGELPLAQRVKDEIFLAIVRSYSRVVGVRKGRHS